LSFFRVQLLISVLSWTTLARAADAPSTASPGAPDAPSAQAADDARRAEAKARYEDGVQAYAGGRYKDAVDLFLAADKLSPSAPLSFNIARAYEKLGDDSGALRWYRDYLRRSPNAQNAGDVTAAIARYEARLAKKGVQQVTVLSTPSGATVSVDDANLGVTPGTFDLPPGHHVLTLLLRGYNDASAEFELAPDRAQDVVLTLSRAATPAESTGVPPIAAVPIVPPPAPSEAPKSEPSHGGLGVWPWVVTGAGVVALGGALTFELLRASAEKDAKNDPTQIGYKDKLDTMESRRTTARVLAGVGGALVVTGGVMLTLDLLGGRRKERASLYLAPTAGGALGSLRGSF
jgi:tetratricopeptide (TPR) repeat protein